MSSNREDVQLVLDNRCNIAKASHALVRVSGNNINYFETPADTPGNYDSIITFNSIITPSLASTLISRNPRIRYTVTVTLDETASAVIFPGASYYPVFPDVVANSQYQANTVLRAFPLQSVCGTLSTTINGATTTINSRMLIDLVQRKLDKGFVMNQASECPSQPDNVAGLCVDQPVLTVGTTGAVISNVAGTVARTYQSNSNQVLSKYENSNGANRASFRPVSISPSYQATEPGLSNARVIVFEVSEPILQSPFTQHDSEAFLCNINTMSMIWNLQQKNDMLVSALSVDGVSGFAPACLTSLNLSEARLEWTYIQVPQDLVTIPAVASYPYDNLVYFNKTYTGVAVGNNMSGIQTDTIRFNCQPDLIMIAARLPRANRAAATAADTAKADIFFGMGQWTQSPGLAGISVNYGVKNGLLSGCSNKTLFRISKRNGWKGSWNDWVNGQAVLYLNPALDLGIDLNAGDALPMENAANQNFQINLTLNAQPFNYAGVNLGANTDLEVIVAPVYKGIVNITPNNALFNLGELSHAEVMQALAVQPKSGQMITDEHVAPSIKGAGLFSSLKSIVGKTADALKSDVGQKALSMGLDYAKNKFLKK